MIPRGRLLQGSLFVATLAIAVGGTVPARAAEPPEEEVDEAALRRARRHFRKGEKLYALGRFEEALGEYQAAFEEAPLPAFLFNIAQCHRNLGRYDAAIFSFKKYLRLAPDAENRLAVERTIEELERAREEERRRAAAASPPRLDPIPRGPAAPPPPPAPSGRNGPFYRKPWFLATVGVVVVGAAAAFVLYPRDAGLPDSDLGNLDFPR